jgi:nucleosome assembly protein 1-like 1
MSDLPPEKEETNEEKNEKEKNTESEEVKKEEEGVKESKEEKELSPLEEDRKDLYDAIKDLKPEDANDNIKAKVLLLADVHLDYKKVEDEKYNIEYDALQDKYDRQYQNIYARIEEIVKSKDKIEIDQEDYEKYGIKDEGENHEIEDYWNKVIINSRYFTINEKDKTIIKYIKKVNMVKFPENVNNFRVDFIFQPNEFFTPEILSKTYEYNKEGTLKKAIGTDIEWKSKEKNPTIEKVKKKVKRGKKFIQEMKEEKVDSFFSFFSQVDDMTFLTDEVTFFKDDLFVNQLEYYLDIVSKTKNGGLDDEDLDDDYDYGEDKGEEVQNADGKKEECKQQ